MNRTENPSAPHDGSPAREKLDREIAENAGLTPAELATLRTLLLDARDAIERKRATHIDLALPAESHLADDMDQASRDQDMGFALLLAGKDQDVSTEIEAALKRFEDGTYGVCEGTDEPIGFRRLEARPWTRYSVGYQEQLEREGRARGAR
jgi:DnaK suppressor protein